MKKNYLVTFFLLVCTCISLEVFAEAVPPFTSSNLPIVVITTSGATIVDDPKVTVHMGIINNGNGQLNYLTDPYNDYDGLIGIEFRGNSSQQYPKKSYGFETRDSTGNDINVSILGMPAESEWTLIATPLDKTLIKNGLMYTLWKQLGYYSVRFIHCELIIDGEYRGVYALTEKIKRDGDRVDIKKLDEADSTQPRITGGYIIKNDWVDPGDQYWNSPLSNSNTTKSYIAVYPKSDNITTQQFDYIKDYFLSFETVLKSTNFDDPVNGYKQYIDETTFRDYFLIQEFCKNLDGYLASIYFYKDRGKKLKIGSVWDFDSALFYDGAHPCCNLNLTSGWISKNSDLAPLAHFWWQKLLTDCSYASDMRYRYQSLRQGVLSTANVMAIVDSLKNQLSQGAVQRNNDKWQYTFFGRAIDHNQEISQLKTWITNRLAWMDANIYQMDPFTMTISGGSTSSRSFGQTYTFTTTSECLNGGQKTWEYLTSSLSQTYMGNTLTIQAAENTTVKVYCTYPSGCSSFPSNPKQLLVSSPPCPQDLVTNSTVQPPTNAIGIFQANETVTATNKLFPMTVSTFKAGKSITLLPGFHADTGSVFSTQLESCQ